MSSFKWPASGASAGTVTSVGLTVPTFLSVSGSPVTGAGTLAVTYSGTALPIANGGTGQTSAANAINALLPDQTSANGQFLTSNGSVASWASASVPDPLQLGNGSAAAPTYSFSSHTNTGWYSPGANTVDLSLSGHLTYIINDSGFFPADNNSVNLGAPGNAWQYVVGSQLRVDASGLLLFFDANRSNFVAFNSPAVVASDVIWTLPAALGAAGSVLTDVAGNGILSWAAGGGGAWTNPVAQSLQFSGSSDREINMTQSSGSGTSLYITASQGADGSNRSGGNVYISGGQATGNSSSGVHFAVSVPGASGTDLTDIDELMILDGATQTLQLQSGTAPTALLWYVTDNSKYVGLKAKATMSNAAVIFSLPDGDGSSGQFLSTDGSASLSWVSPFVSVSKTVTPGGTTGNQTINKTAGTVNFAASASSLTVTNSLVTSNSIVFAVVRTNDTTATIKNVVCSSNSFVITLTAAATAETSVGFVVVG